MTGLTKNGGWQVGARRTLPLQLDEAWDLLTSPPWLHRWSGLTALEAGDPAVRSLNVQRVVQVRAPASLVQLRLLPTASGTTIAFHEERLHDERTRGQRKGHWTRLWPTLRQSREPADDARQSDDRVRWATSHYKAQSTQLSSQ